MRVKVIVSSLLICLLITCTSVYADDLNLGITIGEKGIEEWKVRYEVSPQWNLQFSGPLLERKYTIYGLYKPNTILHKIVNPYLGIGYSSVGDNLLTRAQVTAGVELPLEKLFPNFNMSLDMKASTEGTFIGVSFFWKLGGEPIQPHDDNILLLARLITAEAENQPFEGQVAVGAVVLNRLKSSEFPNTIREVIYQPGQFMPVSDGRIRIEPTSISFKAAEAALAGEDPSRGALYFYNPAKATQNGLRFMATRTVTVKIADHIFCK